ncbi:MAG: hypothetical protein KC425_19230, partial [Anaerolineales bacterium]|nr:hypothetical protein [Anaerolineales bacterium]
PSATPSPTSAPPTDTPTPVVCTELLANGGFEQVGAWVIEVNAYPAGYETAVVHSGSWAARIGIVNPADNQFSYSSIWQTVSVPAGVDQATLTFWLHTLSSGARWGPPANFDLDGLDLALLTDDAQYVLVYDQANQQHTLVFQRVNAGAWQAFQFDLTGFAGQTIRLYFGVFNNGSGGVTGMYLDDVSLRVCQE